MIQKSREQAASCVCASVVLHVECECNEGRRREGAGSGFAPSEPFETGSLAAKWADTAGA